MLQTRHDIQPHWASQPTLSLKTHTALRAGSARKCLLLQTNPFMQQNKLQTNIIGCSFENKKDPDLRKRLKLDVTNPVHRKQ